MLPRTGGTERKHGPIKFSRRLAENKASSVQFALVIKVGWRRRGGAAAALIDTPRRTGRRLLSTFSSPPLQSASPAAVAKDQEASTRTGPSIGREQLFGKYQAGGLKESATNVMANSWISSRAPLLSFSLTAQPIHQRTSTLFPFFLILSIYIYISSSFRTAVYRARHGSWTHFALLLCGGGLFFVLPRPLRRLAQALLLVSSLKAPLRIK